MKCSGCLKIFIVGVTPKRRKPVTSRKKYKISSLNFENGNRIRVGIERNTSLKFSPKLIYKHPVKHSLYRSVIQWHVGCNLYKLFTDIPFPIIINSLES